MPHSIVCGDVCPFGDREGAAGCHYPVAGNHHCSIMKRGVLEEEVHYKTAVDACVDSVSCAYHVVKRAVMSDHDQGTCLVFGHSSAGFCEVIDSFAAYGISTFLAKNLVHDGFALCIVHISVSELDQEFSDLWLEDDDQCYESEVQHHVHYGGHKPHVERVHHYPDEIERNDGHEYAHGRRTPYPPEHEEDDQAEKDYVKYVRN